MALTPEPPEPLKPIHVDCFKCKKPKLNPHCSSPTCPWCYSCNPDKEKT